MKTVTKVMSDGTKIVYDEYGNDQLKTVFLLHGNGSSAHYFKRQLPSYTAYFHVIAIDSRGHGRSTNTKKSIDMADVIRDIDELRRELSIDKIIIVGYSDGANIALKYAVENQNHVSRMVLNAPNVTADGVYRILWWGNAIARFGTELFSPISQKARRRHMQLHVMSEPLDITRAQLKVLTIPILFVIGQFDIVKRQHIESISKIMPVAKVMILRGHGHFVTYTNPRKFAQLITPFLLGGKHEGH
ncbi:alpha/beta fold hydrolase [Leuconostoc mesenteroides]|uniref:alpha/beta fold hydrolase n=1 Tax=Leuconostoc mesenteroides TaxID=1245 RepID=UPI000B9D5A0D|nr:alpha/beta hydrolase [Leuconostoc mesenteroides]BAX72002.1 alpha/beta fold family hydrolase [Leuconostoc mesenteroides]